MAFEGCWSIQGRTETICPTTSLFVHHSSFRTTQRISGRNELFSRNRPQKRRNWKCVQAKSDWIFEMQFNEVLISTYKGCRPHWTEATSVEAILWSVRQNAVFKKPYFTANTSMTLFHRQSEKIWTNNIFMKINLKQCIIDFRLIVDELWTIMCFSIWIF